MTSASPLLSLIIPHRNHTAVLPRLLDSILAQSLKDLEVILVDDCSDAGERCGDIVAAYREQGLPVRLIANATRQYTKNSRLIGVEASLGQVIGFADADDELWGTEALEYHVRLLLETKADILHFAAMESSPAKPAPHVRLLPLARRLRGGRIFSAYAAARLLPSSLWNKLCRRSLWDAILPQAWHGENILFAEDRYLTSLLFFHAEHYVGSRRPGYHYRFEHRKHHKRLGRIATHYQILRMLVPYFEQQARAGSDVQAYASRIRKELDSELEKYTGLYARRISDILQAYIDFEDQRHHAHVLSVDRTRGLLGILHLGAADESARRFLIDGSPHAPVFHRCFPLESLHPALASMHIVWLAYPDAFHVLEARLGDAPLPLVHAGATAPCLRAEDVFASPCKPERPLSQACAALLARLPFIRNRFSGCWLLADSDPEPDGNAEHLYRWLMRMHPERKLFFALNKDSSAWARLEKEGFNLLDPEKLSYFFAWVHCAWLIASDMAEYVMRPGWRAHYRDMVRHQLCLLRRGDGEEDQSDYSESLVDMVVTAARREYARFAEDPRYAGIFPSCSVQLTGFPRHDELLRKARAVEKAKTVLIMPAWRQPCGAYCRGWQTALQAKTLFDAARAYGYSVLFLPHPHIRQQLRDCKLDGVTVLPDAGGNIQDLLADTALFITDYSSIAMDAAFIGRCVLYFQLDRETFFTPDHGYTEGSFNYERDGFGEVVQTVDELCAKAAALMGRGCPVEERYRSRADAFFAFRDQHNCQRVYAAICRLSGPVISKVAQKRDWA